MTVFEHIKAELKEAATVAWQSFKKCLAIVYVIFFSVAGLSTLTASELTLTERVLGLALVATYLIGQSVVIAAVFATMSIVRHIAGWAAILPLLCSIAAILITLWLATSPLQSAWQEVLNILQKESGSLKSIPFVRVAHPLFLLFIIPFILLRFLGSYAIWTAALQYIGLVLLATLLGLVLGLMLATPPTLLCIYKRLKERATQREEALACI